MVCVGLSFILALLERLSGEWTTITVTAIAAFSAANAVEYLKGAK